MISDARPGVQNFSKSTLPEANQLVRDLRELSQSLKAVSDRVNQQGIGGTLGPEETARLQARETQMRLLTRLVAPIALAGALGGCSLGGLLGGGGKPPTTLQTLTPEAADPGPIATAVNAGRAVTIGAPRFPRSCARSGRAPVR